MSITLPPFSTLTQLTIACETLTVQRPRLLPTLDSFAAGGQGQINFPAIASWPALQNTSSTIPFPGAFDRSSHLGAFDQAGFMQALQELAQVMQQSFLGSAIANQSVRFDPGQASAQSGPRFAAGAELFKQGKDSPALQEYMKKNLHMEWTDRGWNHDAEIAGKVTEKLKNANVKIDPNYPGKELPKEGPGKIDFSASEAQRIQRAIAQGGDAAGRQEVLKIFSEKTGEPVFEDPQELDKEYSSRLHKYDVCTKYDHLTDEQLKNRDVMTSNTRAMNKLFGTSVPANEDYSYNEKDEQGRQVEKVGHGNKRGMATAVLLDVADNVVAGMKQSAPFASVHQSYAESFFGCQPPGFLFASSRQYNASYVMPVASQGFSADATSYLDGIKQISECYTPIVFDLQGLGFKIKDSELVPFDIDVDGKDEYVSDLQTLGVLVLESSKDSKLTGEHLFGSFTDLARLGIAEDGFENGYASFAALVNHYGLLTKWKRHLDAHDLRFLEDHAGLRMRVGGLVGGRNLRFAELGVTRVDVGRLEDVQSLGESEPDMWMNRAMRQKGATFVMNGRTLPYADLWFNVQARAVEKKPKKIALPAVARRV